jgi:hypothetical protein
VSAPDEAGEPPTEGITNLGDLYERDFLLWAQHQAGELRRAKGTNLPLDWENLAEEIESLGKSQRRELESQIRRILRHLFALEASPASDPRAGWHATVDDARADVESLLRDSPSLRREVAAIVSRQASMAGRLAVADLAQYAEPGAAVRARLEQGGFTADQVLGDWFPDPAGAG